MKSNVKKDLDTLSKNLYLESPDLWIEFLDKVNSGIFDELVLFFATKYNYISIVKYAIDNNLIDINSKSRNKEFATIYDHLAYVARQNNYKDFSDYFSNLKNPNKEISQNNENDKTNIKTKNKDINIPSLAISTGLFSSGENLNILFSQTIYPTSKIFDLHFLHKTSPCSKWGEEVV